MRGISWWCYYKDKVHAACYLYIIWLIWEGFVAWPSTYLVLVIWEGEHWNWVIFGPAHTLDGAIDAEKSPGLETSLHNSLSVCSGCLEPQHQIHMKLHWCVLVWYEKSAKSEKKVPFLNFGKKNSNSGPPFLAKTAITSSNNSNHHH